MPLHLRHEALRMQFPSAIWMVTELEGVLVSKTSEGWVVNLSDPDDPDGGFSPHHPLAEKVFWEVQEQRFATRQELLQALQVALELSQADEPQSC